MAPTSEVGKTSAKDLSVGLYLLVETKVPEMVTSTTNPFFVSLPMTTVTGNDNSVSHNGGTAWNYNVVVYPKQETGIPTLEKTVREAKADTGKRTSGDYYDTLIDDCHVFSFGLDLAKLFSDVDAETAAETKLYDSVKFKIQNKTDGTWIIAKRNDEERQHGEYSGYHGGNDNKTYTSAGFSFSHLMLALLDIVQGVISTIMQAAGFGQPQSAVLPSEIVSSIEDCGFFESIPLWAITLIGGMFIWVLSFQMILSVYGRFFKMFMYTAIAPIPLSTFAGEPTQSIGKSFLKSYASVCLEGAVIVLACVIFSAFASSPPVVDAGTAAATMVWSYIGELIFNMLILVGSVKMADRAVREMMGL